MKTTRNRRTQDCDSSGLSTKMQTAHAELLDHARELKAVPGILYGQMLLGKTAPVLKIC